jgi:hypothetical protein
MSLRKRRTNPPHPLSSLEHDPRRSSIRVKVPRQAQQHTDGTFSTDITVVMTVLMATLGQGGLLTGA